MCYVNTIGPVLAEPGGGEDHPYSYTLLGRVYRTVFLESNVETGIEILVTQTNMYTVN